MPPKAWTRGPTRVETESGAGGKVPQPARVGVSFTTCDADAMSMRAAGPVPAGSFLIVPGPDVWAPRTPCCQDHEEQQPDDSVSSRNAARLLEQYTSNQLTESSCSRLTSELLIKIVYSTPQRRVIWAVHPRPNGRGTATEPCVCRV